MLSSCVVDVCEICEVSDVVCNSMELAGAGAGGVGIDDGEVVVDLFSSPESAARLVDSVSLFFKSRSVEGSLKLLGLMEPELSLGSR